MKQDLIKDLFEKFEAVCYEIKGVECWSARELQDILGYKEWRNFLKVIDKAKETVVNSGDQFENHFVEINKMVSIGSGSTRSVEDIAITRYACYLIAQNGDPFKPAIAFAQTYFAVQTRRAELMEQRILDYERVKAREKLSQTEKQLSGILYERGIDEKGFAIIRSKGDQALFKLSTIQERGIRPEELPPAEDVKKVQRKLEKEEKKMLKDIKQEKGGKNE